MGGLRSRGYYLDKLGDPNPLGELALDTRDAAVPSFLPDQCFAIVGNLVTVITPPLDALVIGMSVEVESFTIRTGDQLPRTITGAGSDTLTITGHDYFSGYGPFEVFSTSTVPAGLAVDTLYYVSRIDGNTVGVHLSREDAEAGTNAVTITGLGIGTQTMGNFAEEAAISEQSVGNNIIKLNAGDGKGNNPILPVFLTIRARALTVSGQTSNSIMKYAIR